MGSTGDPACAVGPLARRNDGTPGLFFRVRKNPRLLPFRAAGRLCYHRRAKPTSEFGLKIKLARFASSHERPGSRRQSFIRLGAMSRFRVSVFRAASARHIRRKFFLAIDSIALVESHDYPRLVQPSFCRRFNSDFKVCFPVNVGRAIFSKIV